MRGATWCRAAIALLAACAPAATRPKPNVDPVTVNQPLPKLPADTAPAPASHPSPLPPPSAPPALAYRHGRMPLSSTKVNEFRRAHPESDGRGVLIAILDSGIDPGIPGLDLTSTGERKVLDLRDFSDEGAVPLRRVSPEGDSVLVAGHWLRGIGRVAALDASGRYYAGTLRELALGAAPGADLNGNGEAEDTLAVIVAKASDGWVLFADTDGDGSLANEHPVHDFLLARESFGWAARGDTPRLNLAANFSEERSEPRLDLFFDTSSHGSHVAGIAAGHDMYGVKGFDGVAPGAQLIALKICNNAQDGVSTTGSMIRALDYAIRFAELRRLPLVVNLSFGVANSVEGTARIDALVDSVLALHPDVVFVAAAGNDGPGLSTAGFPASALRAISVGASLPASFLAGLDPSRSDVLWYFSSRGGELAVPDFVAPGIAYSTVPRWNSGAEEKTGTSMASPQVAGMAALLLSAVKPGLRRLPARTIRQALLATAHPLPGEGAIDAGTGLVDIPAAYAWLVADHEVPDILVQAVGHGATAAYRATGLETPGDTLQEFRLARSPGAGGATMTFRLRSDAAWLAAPASVALSASPGAVTVRYRATELHAPGLYTGVVSGWTADTLAGPVFRLVNTVRVPYPAGESVTTASVPIVSGAQARFFFQAEAARPFLLRMRTPARGQQALAFLHEPDGSPYRAGNGAVAGPGEDAAVYQPDARDVQGGAYEAVAVALPGQGGEVRFELTPSPVLLDARRDANGVGVSLVNRGNEPVAATALVSLVGAERGATVVARGSDVQHIPFVIPDWAVRATVDVSMEPAQYSRFTDFGITLFDSTGHQIAVEPMHQAYQRVTADLTKPRRTGRAELALFPGLAEPSSQERWTATVWIRLYADSLRAVDLGPVEMPLDPGATGKASLRMPEAPFTLGDAFHMLGVLAVRVKDQVWQREVPLAPPSPPLAR